MNVLPPERIGSPAHLATSEFSTPEQMLAAQKAGLPHWDVDAMTRAGTAARAANHGPTSAASIGFDAPRANVTPRELIAAFKRIDVRPVIDAGLTPTAIFDFDDTLIGGQAFFDFVTLLIARVPLPQSNAERVARLLSDMTQGRVSASDLEGQSTNAIIARALGLVKAQQLPLSTALFLVIAGLAGVRESDVSAVAEELFTKGLPGEPPYATRFFNHDHPDASAETLVRTLISRGVEPHIVTLGLPVVARAGAKLLGVPPDHVHGFELEVKDGVITGRAVNARVIGKHIICDELVSPSPLFAFGDSVGSDAPMLSRATAGAFAVNPDQEFRDHIAKNHADVTGLAFEAPSQGTRASRLE